MLLTLPNLIDDRKAKTRQRAKMSSIPTDKAGDLLKRAIAAAQGGDFARARHLAHEGLAGDVHDKTALHAFLGMVEARHGNLAGAAEHLQAAHSERPQDITIACNLIAILMDLGQDEDALATATRKLAHGDSGLRIARYRAFLAQKLEKFEDAVEAYEMVIAKAPDDFESWNNLGNARAGLDDHKGAVEALRRAIELDPRTAPARLNLVSALIALGREEEAAAELLRATQDFPTDSRPPYQLYVLYKTQLKQDDALEALLEAERRDPEAADIQLKLGIEYGVVRRTEEAERAYRRTIELDPAETDAYLGLAIQYEHTNREDEFPSLIELGRTNGLEDGTLAFIEALELRRQKRFEEALARLDDVPEAVEPIRTEHIRATLLDRLDRTDEAFTAFAKANTLQQDNPTEPIERAAMLRDRLTGEIANLTTEPRDGWTDAAVTDDRPDPVFLVGFPRSGTTLLDTILMGHPGTAVMEEQPPLNIVEEELGGLTALPKLDAAAIARARYRYFEEVEKLHALASGQLLVDKSPLFLYRIPLIQRLFPRAKIILALRHPCDVVLSCFMSNFRLNSAMANFLRLEDAAVFYDLCFRHWEVSRDLFEPNVHTVTYEKLVEDVESELRPLTDWLGIEWDPRLLDHTATAKARGLITTASYSQVTEPIYRRASGRWLRYREHLAPILGTLAPWAEKFGYEDPRKVAAGG